MEGTGMDPGMYALLDNNRDNDFVKWLVFARIFSGHGGFGDEGNGSGVNQSDVDAARHAGETTPSWIVCRKASKMR